MDDIPIRKDIPKVGDFENIPIRVDVQQQDVWDGTEESWEAYMKQSEEEYLSTLTDEQKQKLAQKRVVKKG